MIINHNISALNTYRQLSINTGMQSKSLEKLSSGLRINRAGDDAAGLSISEKMRAQIRGLNMATKNAQDGISLIQTAEGALTETHAILQRMRELAVQAANDTNVGVDRTALQAEVNELLDEIDRIATQTEFNTQKLLNGQFTDRVFHIGANAGQNISLSIGNMGTSEIGSLKVYRGSWEFQTPSSGSTTLEVEVGGETYSVTVSGSSKASGVVAEMAEKLAGTGVSVRLSDGDIVFESKEKFTASDGSTSIDIDEDNIIENLGALRASGGASAGGILTQADADKAISAINNAIEAVSSERSKLGAYQNRLEHTINNLGASAENLQAAESRIRDVDMAKEMMEFTKMNILSQAATAMLAQANQQPQLVLQLLR